MDTHIHTNVNKQNTWKIETWQTKAHETRPKNVRKTPVLTHFQRKEIKHQRKVMLKDGKYFFEKST